MVDKVEDAKHKKLTTCWWVSRPRDGSARVLTVADAAAEVQAETLGDIVVDVETTALVNLVADIMADAVE